jgi:hypothetical protein
MQVSARQRFFEATTNNMQGDSLLAHARASGMAWAELTADCIAEDLATLAGRTSSSSFDNEASLADLCLGADARSVTALQHVLHCGGLRCVHDLLLLLPGLSPQQQERAEVSYNRHTAAVAHSVQSVTDLLRNAAGERVAPGTAAHRSVTAAQTVDAFCSALLRHPRLTVTFSTADAVPSNAKDQRDIQLVRDLERDVLSLNGAVLGGGAIGFQAILTQLTEQLTAQAQAVKWWGPSASTQIAGFAKLALRAVNRTESGGLSFEAICSLLQLCSGAAAELIVVPASTSALPLVITSTAGPFQQADSDTSSSSSSSSSCPVLGLRLHIEAVTVYSLFEQDNMELPLLRIIATYRSRLFLALSPPAATQCTDFSDIGYCAEAGIVELAFEPVAGRTYGAKQSSLHTTEFANAVDTDADTLQQRSSISSSSSAAAADGKMGALFDRLHSTGNDDDLR